MGKKKRPSSGKKPRGRAGRLVAPAFGLVEAGASRARALLKRLLSSRRGRLRATGAFASAARPGKLEAFQHSIDELENRAASFDLSVDFGHFRRRLEALLSVLLEVEDDYLVGEAVAHVREDLEMQLPRVEAIFVVPEALFARLELARPSLAHVRTACESGNYGLARTALLEHLSEKPLPEDLAKWLRRRSSRAIDEARLVGRGFALGVEGWTFMDQSVAWEKMRACEPHLHFETAALARAYVEAGDEVHAKEAIARILGWAARVPPPGLLPVEGAAAAGVICSGPGEAACAAERLLNWAVTFVALRRSKALSPEAARAFLVLVRESAEVVRERSRGAEALASADQAAAGAALLVAAALFDEFSDAPAWNREGKRLLEEVARTRVLPDGGWSSATFGPHERVFECFVAAALAAPGEDTFSRTAASMLEFASTVVFPDGRFPGEAGLDPTSARDRLDRFARARSVLGLGEAPAAPAFAAFDHSGVLVMRTGAGEEADSLVLRTAPPSGIHIAAGGSEILCSHGTLTGTGGERDEATTSPPGGALELSSVRSVVHRAGPPCEYVRATFGLRGGGPGGREVPQEERPRATAQDGPFSDGPASGRSARPRAEPIVTEVLYVGRRFWVVAARFRSEAESERRFELRLLPPECLPSADGRRLVLGSGGPSALVALAAPTDSGFRIEETSVGLVASATACGEDVHFIALVYPLHGEDSQALSVEPVVVTLGETPGGGIPATPVPRPGRAAGLILKGPDAEYAVCLPHGEGGIFGDETPFGGLGPGVQVAAMTRSDGPWRVLCSVDRDET